MSATFDTSASGASNAFPTSITFAHAVGVDATALVVGCDASGGITTVTYNAVGMTKVNTKTNSHHFTLVNPATGSNNVVISQGGGDILVGISTSIKGTLTTQGELIGTTAVSVEDPTVSPHDTNITTSAVNSIIIDFLKMTGTGSIQYGKDQAGQTDTSARAISTGGGDVQAANSYYLATAAQQYTMGWEYSGGTQTRTNHLLLEIIAAPTPPPSPATHIFSPSGGVAYGGLYY